MLPFLALLDFFVQKISRKKQNDPRRTLLPFINGHSNDSTDFNVEKIEMWGAI